MQQLIFFEELDSCRPTQFLRNLKDPLVVKLQQPMHSCYASCSCNVSADVQMFLATAPDAELHALTSLTDSIMKVSASSVMTLACCRTIAFMRLHFQDPPSSFLLFPCPCNV